MTKHRKLTKRKLKALIKDERSATKEYAKLGFKKLSKDEGRHAKFLIAKSKSLKVKRKQAIEEFERMRNLAELRALSKKSLRTPPSDREYNRMMQLKKEVFEK